MGGRLVTISRSKIRRSAHAAGNSAHAAGKASMIDKLIERTVPWGAFLALGALVGAAFPRETRQATRTVMLTGLRAVDWISTVGAEAYEKGQDVFAEARLEYDELQKEAERQAERGQLRVVRGSRRRPSSAGRKQTRRAQGREASSDSR